jgi:prevent-host-death family protein
MPTVDATTFRRDFGRYQDEAHREPVTVTSHGRVIGVFLSSRDLEHYERLKRRERQVLVAGEIPDELIEAIQKAEYLKPAQ